MTTAESKYSYDYLKSLLIAPAQHKKLLFAIIILLIFYTCTGRNYKNNQFDYFVFSQRWLPTACIEYKEHGSSSENPHHCVLPKNFEFWAIHGLWPTKYKHMGPFFCNKSMPFDISKILPIESNLESYWPNIEGGKSVESLWQHEWDKHGTCAAELETLNSEMKYFNTTLKFFKEYNIQDLFKRNNILPPSNTEINVSSLFHLIKSTFGKLPQVHCINEVKWNQPYLSEIRLCYNKNLELMDCESISGIKFCSRVDRIKTLTNCPFNRKIILPSKVDIDLINKLLKNSGKTDYQYALPDILRLLRFLEWASI